MRVFKKMLEAAKNEHPDKDIIVKTHPEAFRGGRKGYFTSLKKDKNIIPFTDPICPYSLIEIVDEVYCVTTQMGFEALMCGKGTLFWYAFLWRLGCYRRPN